jgi:hypothetical protein
MLAMPQIWMCITFGPSDRRVEFSGVKSFDRVVWSQGFVNGSGYLTVTLAKAHTTLIITLLFVIAVVVFWLVVVVAVIVDTPVVGVTSTYPNQYTLSGLPKDRQSADVWIPLILDL